MQTGSTIQNYEVIRQIGVGGMGEVWLGRHKLIGREVAIKSLHKQLVQKESIRLRFKNEAATLARLQHPNVVALLDYHEDDEGVYLIMEYVEGMPLDEYIEQKSGPIPEPLLSQLFTQILAGVQYAHSKKIVHRDIKPSNFLITKDNTLKILDFGIAKLLDQSDHKLTKTGTAMGTVLYMSPEQVKGESVDHRSDIYSLGVTLFQMATGQCPYDKFTTEFYVYDQIVNHSLPNSKSIYPGVSDHIQFLIQRATEKNPVHRFQSGEDFSEALGSSSHTPSTAEKDSSASQVPSDNQKKKPPQPPPPPVLPKMEKDKIREVPNIPPSLPKVDKEKENSNVPPAPPKVEKDKKEEASNAPPKVGRDKKSEASDAPPKVERDKKAEASNASPEVEQDEKGSVSQAPKPPSSPKEQSTSPESQPRKGSRKPKPTADSPPPKKKRKLLYILLGILILGGVGTGIALLSGKKTKSEKLFVIASNLFLRLEPYTEAEKDDKLPYGTEIEVLGRPNSDWVEIEQDGQTRYLATKYLRDRKKFMKMNYIFTNSEGKQLLDGSYHKLALEAHFTKMGYRTDLPSQDYEEIYGVPKSDVDIWQVDALGLSNSLNTAIPSIKLEKSQWKKNETRNSAVIVNNKNNANQRQLLAFKHTPNGNNEIGTLDISNFPGHYIVPVNKRKISFIADEFSDNLVIKKEMKFGKEAILLATSSEGYSSKLVLWLNGSLKMYPLLYHKLLP